MYAIARRGEKITMYITWFLTTVSLIMSLSLRSNGVPKSGLTAVPPFFRCKKEYTVFLCLVDRDVLWCIFDLAYKMYDRSTLDFVQVILYI